MERIQFDDSRARTYRKRAEVLAFRSDDAIVFRKTWGEQSLRPGGWVIVPLSDDGKPLADVYGCDADVFEATYGPSPSLRPSQYRKKVTVRAYQSHHRFEVDTVLEDGHVEARPARSTSDDAWIVRGPGGETYPVDNETFARTYVEAPD